MSLLFPPRPEDFKFAEAKSPRLRIVTYSDEIRTLIVRGITKTGLIHDTYLTTDDRHQQTRIIALTEIPLTVLVECSSIHVQRGQLFCQLFLEFAGVPAASLAADYISTGSPLSWPISQIHSPTEGTGALLSVEVNIPAAGINTNITVPTNTLWKILGLNFRFITSVAIATREAIVRLRDTSSNLLAFSRPTITQAASEDFYYIFTTFHVVPATFSDYIAGHLSPHSLITNEIIGSFIQNIQAADQIDEIFLRVEQWLNP